MNSRWIAWIVGLVTAVSVALVTSPAASRALALDDVPHLREFPAANGDVAPAEVFRLRHWQNRPGDGLWRPLGKLVWRAVGPLEDGRTRGAWLLTAALAGLCAGLLGERLARVTDVPFAGVLGALPVMHGAAADVLLPFVGQADLLAIAGVLAYWGCCSRRGPHWWGAGLCALVAGLLAKESALPAAAAVPAAIFLTGGSRRERWRRARAALLAGAAAVLVRVALQWVLLGGIQPATGVGVAGAGGGDRVVGTLELVGRYAAAIVGDSTPQTDYTFLRQPASSATIWPAVGGFVAVAWVSCLLAMLWWRRARRGNARGLRALRLAAGGWLWAGIFLLPYLHIISFGAIWAGRFAVPALNGVALALAALLPIPRLRVPAALVFGLLVAGGGVGIGSRAADWRSPLALWEAEVSREPEHAFAWKNLASALQAEGEEKAALEAVRRAVDLWPSFGEGHLAHGQIAGRLRRDGESEAALRRARELGLVVPATVELARTLARQGRFAAAEAELSRLPAEALAEPEVVALRVAIRRDLGEGL